MSATAGSRTYETVYESVPTHWRIERLSNRVYISVGGTPPTSDERNFDGDDLWANISDLSDKRIADTAKRVNGAIAHMLGMRSSPEGSLLFSFKLSVGLVSIVDRPMYTNEAIATLTPRRDLDIGFAYYALPVFILENASENIYGAKILNQSGLRRTRVAFPPLIEQRAIADYLDRETAQIDEFVVENERFIELLTERRAAVIAHAVTKGLDPDAPLRDSGVEWLGEVPEGWDVAPMRRSVRIKNGADYTDVEVPDGGYPVYGSGGEFRRASKYMYDGESVLFGRKGTVDHPLHVSGAFWTVDTMFYTVIDQKRLVPRYLYYAATTLPYSLWSTSTALPSMTSSALLAAALPHPPLAEQRAIAGYLDERTARIDEAIATAREGIALAKERRTALISAAVTGKIDVGSGN